MLLNEKQKIEDLSINEYDNLLNFLIEWITPIMNLAHGVKFSNEFWARILRKHLKNCIYRINFYSTKIYRKRIVLVNFQTYYIPTFKEELRNAVIFLWNNFKLGGLKDKWCLLKTANNIILGNRSEMMQKFQNGLNLGILKGFRLGIRFKPRKILNSIAGKEKSIIKKNILYSIPAINVEFFQSNFNSVPLINPADKVFHMEHVGSFTNEILLAKYRENGSFVIQYQCGFGPGEVKNTPTTLDYSIIDKYRTYGWSNNKKDEPYIAIRLIEFEKDYKKVLKTKQEDVILLYARMNQKRKVEYYNLTKQFVQKIDRKKYPEIMLRPRPLSKKISNVSQFKHLDYLKHYNLKVDPGMSPIYELVAKSKLMVHLYHPSTNFLECIFVEHPVMALLTNNNPTDEIKRFYDFFLDKKVLHLCIDSLVEHLNKMNLISWWSDFIKHPILREYKRLYTSEKMP